MKVIDLLNKIANGEEVPKKIRFYDEIFEFTGYNSASKNYNGEPNDLFEELDGSMLNDEIEVIEDKKIEKLEYNKVLHDGTEDADLPDEYYCEDCYIGIKGDDETNIRLKIINKINEIIDEINKEKEGK